MKNEKVTVSLYRQIAIDIARNIESGKYVQGERLFGRSVLASHYKVSPETIRKAVFLLKDMGILATEKGSGIEIISQEKAKVFLEHNSSVESLITAKKEIEIWMKQQATQTADILKRVEFVINETERFRVASPLNPFQIHITPQCKVIGKTVSELHFWHNTGGTIIAIRRDDSLIISPGPYATFHENDFVFIIGDEAAYSAAIQLIFD